MKWVITAKLHLWWQEKLDFLLVFDTWHDINSQKVRRDFGIWSRERIGERMEMSCALHAISRWESFVGDRLYELCWWWLRPKYPLWMLGQNDTASEQLLIWAWLRGRSPKLLWARDQSWSRQPWMWSLWPVSVLYCILCQSGLWLATGPCPRPLIGWGWSLARPRH